MHGGANPPGNEAHSVNSRCAARCPHLRSCRTGVHCTGIRGQPDDNEYVDVGRFCTDKPTRSPGRITRSIPCQCRCCASPPHRPRPTRKDGGGGGGREPSKSRFSIVVTAACTSLRLAHRWYYDLRRKLRSPHFLLSIYHPVVERAIRGPRKDRRQLLRNNFAHTSCVDAAYAAPVSR